MKGKAVYAMFAMMIMGTAVVSGAYAFGGPMEKALEENEGMQQALENGDYDAFRQGLTEKVSERFTEERFKEMAERHESMEAITQAMEDGDYEAWVAAVDAVRPPSITELVTEDNFDAFVAFHEARENGDIELAQELADSIGIDMRGPGPRGGHKEICPMWA